MEITLRFFGLGSKASRFDKGTITVSPGSSVCSLLTALKAEKGADFFPPGLNPENLFILVNGRNVGHLAGLDTSLNDGDVVSILLPAFGG